MIVLSLVLVIIAAVTLVLGVFQDGLTLIYVSIGTCLAALILLGIGVMLRRREDAAPATSGDQAPVADTGPTSAVTPSAPADDEVRLRESGAKDTSVPEPRPVKKAVVKKVTAASRATEAPIADESDDEADRAFRPSDGPPRHASAGAAASGAAAVGAPRRSDGEGAPDADPQGPGEPDAGDAAGDSAFEPQPAPRSAAEDALQDADDGRATTPATATTGATPAVEKATAKKATAKKATAKKATAKKATAKKATAKKATAKKATAKKATAKKAASTSGVAGGASALPEIRGLGAAKSKALIDHFGSVQEIRDADIAEITAVKGIGDGLARELKRELGGS